jgi:hypothetical protein
LGILLAKLKLLEPDRGLDALDVHVQQAGNNERKQTRNSSNIRSIQISI